MELTTVWFILIAVLWTGYLVLDGYDLGVGMLLPVLGGRRAAGDPAEADRRRRLMLTTIGPHWDGNEVWLLTAGGATFAAFPEWYATLFSGFYLALLVILAGLILRALGIEYRHKRDDDRWRAGWDAAVVFGSWVPAVLWGVALTNIVRGVPIDASGEYVGTFLDLLNPVALLGGATFAALFLTHGALFIAYKTLGPIRDEARALALRTGPVAAVLALVLLGVLGGLRGTTASWVVSGLAAVALVAGLLASRAGSDGQAFAGTAATIGLATVAYFLMLFPDVMPSSLDPAWSLTTTSASSTPYTLRIMTIVAVVFTPIVIGYQAWSWVVFRRRLGTHHIPDSHAPKRA
jgi:cytochrome d ubiquinol oxidase subunit II